MSEPTIEQYLTQHAPALASKITERFRPLVDGIRPQTRSLLRRLERQPFPAQAAAIEGLAGFYRSGRRHGFLIAECGTGKTLMGMAVPWTLHGGKSYRTLVMCPGHLVEKWRREIFDTIPGAVVSVIGEWRDVLKIAREHTRRLLDRPTHYIISRDRAKLGFFRRPATVLLRGRHCCPDCFSPVLDGDGVPVSDKWLATARRSCPDCSAPLWCADNTRCRRAAPVDLIKRFLGKGFFDFGIFDECHELKGVSAQGATHGALMGVCRRTLSMTGSIASGYADDLHYLIAKADIQAVKSDGMKWGSIDGWMDRYGVRETVTRTKAEDRDNVSSRGRPTKHVRRRPGISPVVFSKYLMGRSVFLRLDDVAEALPDYREEVVQVPLGPLESSYRALESAVMGAVRSELARGSKRLLGMMIHSLVSWPDHPFSWKPLVERDTNRVIARPASLDAKVVTPKERKLVDTILGELARRRRVCVFVNNTGAHDVAGRVADLMKREDVEVAVLSSSVSPEKREAWLADRLKDGVRVLVSQVKLVETGLDLIGFPTLVFHQVPLSTFTLRQASRRSWRIGQKEPVKVIYLAYAETLQAKLLSLMASKITASTALEGSFSEDGLAALAGGEDLTTELARTLAQGIRLEDAHLAWRKLGSVKMADTQQPVPEPVSPVVTPVHEPPASDIFERVGRRILRNPARTPRRAGRPFAMPAFA